MTLGANQIGAYAADLLGLEDQIDTLQEGKRDLYASIREEHGKAEAASLKLAVKLSRMDEGKRAEAAAVDTEAQRMLAIIAKGRAPRATRASASAVPEHQISPSVGSVSPETPSLNEAATDANAGGENVAAQHPNENDHRSMIVETDGKRRADAVALGRDVEPVPLAPTTAADNARKIRPWCLHADNLSKCGGMGRQHCASCLKAHADDVGESA